MAKLKKQPDKEVEQEEQGLGERVAQQAKRIAVIALLVWTLVSALGLGLILSNKDRVEAVSWGLSNTTQTLQGKHLFESQATHWLDVPKDQAGN